nr:small heat shock protein [Magelona pitelkai]
MKREMDERVNKVRAKMFHLVPSKDQTSLQRLGWEDLDNLVGRDNKLKLNFDVDDFNEESMRVECVNNQITVHGRKKAKYHEKLGDIETDEEWTKTYELPAQVDPKSVTSSFFKDGVMTVEMPAPENPEKHTTTLEMQVGDN